MVAGYPPSPDRTSSSSFEKPANLTNMTSLTPSPPTDHLVAENKEGRVQIDPSGITWAPDAERPALWVISYRGVPLDLVRPFYPGDTPRDELQRRLSEWV